MAAERDLYAVLGVDRGARDVEVRIIERGEKHGEGEREKKNVTDEIDVWTCMCVCVCTDSSSVQEFDYARTS